MKVLLTHGYFLAEDEKEKAIMKPYPPLGIQCIAAFLEEHGYANEIFDSTFSSLHEMKGYLLESVPDVIGIYTNLMTKINILKIIRFVKSEDLLAHSKVVLGGPEVTNHQEMFLNYGVDALVVGEGETAMLELVRYYENPSKSKIEDIFGISYLDEEKNVKSNPASPFIRDLDSLPFPARNKIDQNQYFQAWKNAHGYSMLTINTMRGCPYGCKWCSRAVYGKSYRRRSPSNVVDEIVQLQENYSFDRFWFVDDVFTINPRWMRGFAAEIKDRGVKIAYEAITRADRMNEEIVQLLKDTGCFRIWIGAESGSQAVLDAMNRMVKIERVTEMVLLAKRFGIEVGTFIMLGYPGEKQKDIAATLNYLKTARPDHYTLTVAYPIKGTPLYEEVESRFVEDLDWDTSTDRDIDFERTFPKVYYQWAQNWIYNELEWNNRSKVDPRAWWAKLKSMQSRMKMRLATRK